MFTWLRRDGLLLLLGVVSVVFLQSCNPLSIADDVEIPQVSPELILNAYLIPEEKVHHIFLAMTLPLNYDYSSYYASLRDYPNKRMLSMYGIIPDAQVILSNTKTGATYQVPFDLERAEYLFEDTDFAIVRGGKYTIEVKHRRLENLKEEFTILDFAPPRVELGSEGVLAWVRIYAAAHENRYFCVQMSLSAKSEYWTTKTKKTFFVSTAQSVDGVINVRHRSVTPLEDFDSPLLVLDTVRIYELDSRAYKFFNALERNSKINGNPFATPALLKNYVKHGFGLATGVLDHGFFVSGE